MINTKFEIQKNGNKVNYIIDKIPQLVFVVLSLLFYFNNQTILLIYKLSYVVYSFLFIFSLLIKDKLEYSYLLFLFSLMFSTRLSDYYNFNINGVVITLEAFSVYVYSIFFFSRAKIYIKKNIAIYLYLLLILFSFLSLISNPNNKSYSIFISSILPQGFIILITITYLYNYGKTFYLIRLLKLILMLCILYATIQLWFESDYFNTLPDTRIVSIFYNPTIFSAVVILLWPLFLVEKFNNLNSFKIFFVVFFILFIELFTRTRGAHLIIFMQIILLLYLYKDKIIKNYKKYLFFLLFIVLFFVYFKNIFYFTVLSRYNYGSELKVTTNKLYSNKISIFDNNVSGGERLIAAEAGYYFGSHNILTGIGLGNFQKEFIKSKYRKMTNVDLESAHNLILNMFAEVGLPVALIWIFMLLFILNRLKNKNSYLSRIIFVSLFGERTYLIIFGGEFIHYHKYISYNMLLFYVILSIGIYITSIKASN